MTTGYDVWAPEATNSHRVQRVRLQRKILGGFQMNVKQQTLQALEDNPGKTAEELADIMGVTPDGVRKALRAYEAIGKAYVSGIIGTKTRLWTFGDGKSIPSKKTTKRWQESAEQREQWRLAAAKREKVRLQQNYVGERIWGI